MDLSTPPVDENELETFRSRWRVEIEKGRDARSPLSSRTSGEVESHPAAQPPIVAETSSPRTSSDEVLKEKELSPLEVYESAIMAERRGNLSEAVIQYRRAFKVPASHRKQSSLCCSMDSDVDKHYLQKYFPSGGAIPAAHPRDDFPTSYATTEYRPPKQGHVDPLKALIATFSELSLRPQIEPEDPEKACVLASLPDELLLHIILQLSLSSLSSLSRTGQVCKKLLLLTTAEASLYKALCKHYFGPFSGVSERLLGDFGGDWRRMLIERPRLRFDGCYIATCHYLRPGVNDFAWNTPIHMVTYFRFLRLYPDGRLISCLTTVEPKEVVHSLSWSGIWALKGVSEGRWRMSETGETSVEVRGPRGYVFVMELGIKSTVRGKHNKLAWMGFHSINQEDREKTVPIPSFRFTFGGILIEGAEYEE